MKQDWQGKHYAFFQNRQCEYFPCHKTDDPDNFNWLFCYCPLYALGRSCGGNCRYTEQGLKDCAQCMLPHRRENYGKILEKFQKVAELARA